MAVAGLAFGLLFQGIVVAMKAVRDTSGSAEATSQVRAALAVIDRQVRSGNVLYSPGGEVALDGSCLGSGTAGSCVRVYTQANGTEKCVQWQVVPDPDDSTSAILRMRSWTPGPNPHSEEGWQTVARQLAVPTQTSLPFNLQGATSTYKSRLLDVRLEAKDPVEDGRTVLLSASLSGRNTNYGYDAGQCDRLPTN